MTRRRSILLAGLLLGMVTACGGNSVGTDAAAPPSGAATSSAAPSSATAAPTTAEPTSAGSTSAVPAGVSIRDFKYTSPASVVAGATVQVRNDDSEAHTVTADSGDVFDAMVTGKATVTFTAPAKPGRYPFHCTYHGNMHGVLVVT